MAGQFEFLTYCVTTKEIQTNRYPRLRAHFSARGRGFVVILLSDFGARGEKSLILVTGSRDEAEFFAKLDGLSAAFGAELVKNTAGVGLHGVFADEELFGDFAVAEALGDEFQDFQFAGSDAEGFALCLVLDERLAGRDWDFFNDDPLLSTGQLETKPDAETGESGCDEPPVDFDGMFNNEETVLGPFEQGDEDSANKTIEEDVALHGGDWKKFYSGNGGMLE